MKKFVLAVATLFGVSFILNAQDVITTKDGSSIEAKVLEITSSSVKYKKYSNPGGPTYTINPADIVDIRYENGDRDILNEKPAPVVHKPYTNAAVVPGMRYKEYRRFYKTGNYVKDADDKYSPALAGIASFIIPGLGQVVDGEVGRGIGIFIGNAVLSSVVTGSLTALVAQLSMEYDYDYSAYDGYAPYSYGYGYSYGFGLDSSTWALIFLGASLCSISYGIWNIADAVKIAKIKNMYLQDTRGMHSSLNLQVSPYIAYTPSSSNGIQPATGLSLRLSF